MGQKAEAEEATNLVRSAPVTAITYERNGRTFLFETTPNPRNPSSSLDLPLPSASSSVPPELLLLLPTPLTRSSPVFVLPASLLRYERENHPRAVNPLIYSRRFLEFCQPRPQSALVLFTLLVLRRRSSLS